MLAAPVSLPAGLSGGDSAMPLLVRDNPSSTSIHTGQQNVQLGNLPKNSGLPLKYEMQSMKVEKH